MGNRAPLPYITAYLQFTIAMLFIVGYFGFLAVLFLGHVTIQPELLELGKTLAVGLSGALGLLFAFLYLRSREAGQPDPSTTTTTTSSTTLPTPLVVPQGSTVVPVPVSPAVIQPGVPSP